MKITLSPKEKYEIELPEEIDINGFRLLVKKLNTVVSFVDGKDTSAKQIGKTTPRSREEIVEALRIYYNMPSNTPETNEALKKYRLKWLNVAQYKWKWIEKFHVTAEELGLAELPDKSLGRPKIQN